MGGEPSADPTTNPTIEPSYVPSDIPTQNPFTLSTIIPSEVSSDETAMQTTGKPSSFPTESNLNSASVGNNNQNEMIIILAIIFSVVVICLLLVICCMLLNRSKPNQGYGIGELQTTQVKQQYHIQQVQSPSSQVPGMNKSEIVEIKSKALSPSIEMSDTQNSGSPVALSPVIISLEGVDASDEGAITMKPSVADDEIVNVTKASVDGDDEIANEINALTAGDKVADANEEVK